MDPTSEDILALQQRIQALEQEQQKNRTELVWSRLLAGGYFPPEEQVLQELHDCGISLPNPNLVLTSVRVETWGHYYSGVFSDYREIAFMVHNIMSDLFDQVYAISYHGQLSLLMNLPETEHAMKEKLVQVVDTMENEYHVTLSFAVSRRYSSVLELSQAADDIRRVFEFQDALEEDCFVSSFDDLTVFEHKPAPASYLDQMSTLISAIRAQDIEQFRKTLYDLIDIEFHQIKPTIHVFPFRVYGLVDTLLYVMDDLRNIVGNDVINQLHIGPRLTADMPLPNLLREIDSILEELEALTHQQKSTIPPWVDALHDYVCENYSDLNLTVAVAADHFHITPTYCSKRFKERYGVRLFDFIQIQRLEAAKALIPTGRSLKEIALMSGFTCSLTMTRAFKRYENMLPSHFKGK